MKWLYYLMIIVSVVAINNPNLFAIGGDMGNGSGTESDPYLIEDFADFNAFASDPNYWAAGVYTQLTVDIDLDPNVTGLPPFTQAAIAPDLNSHGGYQGTGFSGVFDGDGHIINNLVINDGGTGNSFLGLIGYNIEGEVKNLVIENSIVCGNGLAIGTLIGENSGSVRNCYSSGKVTGVYYVGGMVGCNYLGGIHNSAASGSVNGTTHVGGLVGYSIGMVKNCYAHGDVNGRDFVGGLVGFQSYSASDIWNCYSTCDVNGFYAVGGLLGQNNEEGGLVFRCFWDTDTQTHGVIESIGGNFGEVIDVFGIPTEQMKTASTFINSGWDFVDIWNIGENQTYPYLRKFSPADVNKDGIVNFLDLAITCERWLQEM